ncbi:MAG TPA: RMD1 family protein, partial [Candidatus Dormibacteraeota bacterium]|nr:RMD1 family protein [Candidatus Dormibacteraeota bacterium]
MSGRVHQFEAVAFVENFNLRELAQAIPGGRLRAHELRYPLDGGSEVFVYPFGGAVFRDAPLEQRERFLERIRGTLRAPARKVVAESFTVREEPSAKIGFVDGVLQLDELGPARAAAVAIVVAQSAAMEYYERLVDDLFGRTDALVDRLEKSGTV